MLALMFLALIGQPAAPNAATQPRSADSVVDAESKEKRVCRTVKVTGTRVPRKRCATAAEAELEAKLAKDTMRREGGMQALGAALDSIACASGTTQKC